MSHVVVIGAGVFGVWTAQHLFAAGHGVTLIDAYGPGNSRSSSGDESRIVRCGYGPDEIYTQFAVRSLELWREFTARAAADRPLFHQCGVLWLAAGDDPYTAATRRTLERGPYALQVLDGAGLRTRYPHILADDFSHALLELEAGVVMARRSVQTIASDLEARGMRSIRGHVVMPRSEGALTSFGSGPLRSVSVSGGGEVSGDEFVFACGAWLPRVFPDLLTGIIRPTRQVVVYFGTPPGDDRFGPAHMPAWIDFPNGIYGIPDLEGRGLKVGVDRHGPAFDPDADDRVADEASVRIARGWLARRIPVLADAPIIESRVCQYENTSTGDFLIDWHPDHENVLIVGGGSGHGFKHGPAIGEYVTSLLETGGATHERFSLATKTTAAQRAVY
jgi:glycine/D-amino acid oxidase-like deaminating enzyme